MIDLIGWLGTFGVLAAYFMVTKFGMKPRVQVINLFASVALLVYSYTLKAYANVGLNAAWLAIAAYGLIKLRLDARKAAALKEANNYWNHVGRFTP